MMHAKETAGHYVVSDVPIVTPEQTIGEVESMLEQRTASFTTINYMYVVDTLQSRVLVGVVSIKEVFLQDPTVMVSTIMHPPSVTASPETDQEAVAAMALRHNIKAVPVIDSRGVFLGVVTSDRIIEILHLESIEDALRLAGSQLLDDPVQALLRGSWQLHFGKRLPWLLVGLVGGLGAALVVRLFDATLHEQVLVAAFIPAIVYIADAVGSQTQTIFVRALALDTHLSVRNYVVREVVVNILLAIVLGVVMAGVVALWLGAYALALVLGVSVFATVLLAMGTALLVPYVCVRTGYDPAIASGPLATIVRDVLSLLVYFLVVVALL